jgi:hypothetical protein
MSLISHAHSQKQRIATCINAYFARTPDLNWSGEGVYHEILTLQAQMGLVGMALV